MMDITFQALAKTLFTIMSLFFIFSFETVFAQEIPDQVLQEAMEENKSFFQDVLQDLKSESDQAARNEAAAQRQAVYGSSPSSGQMRNRSAGRLNAGLNDRAQSAGASGSMMENSTSMPDNAVVKYNKAKENDPLHGVEMPKRVFNNIDRRR